MSIFKRTPPKSNHGQQDQSGKPEETQVTQTLNLEKNTETAQVKTQAPEMAEDKAEADPVIEVKVTEVHSETPLEADAETEVQDASEIKTEVTYEASQPEIEITHEETPVAADIAAVELPEDATGSPAQEPDIYTEVVMSAEGDDDNGGNPPPLTIGGGYGNDGDGETVDIASFSEAAYLEYSMSVVIDRALPYVQDGQKPVQRRILYAMDQLGLSASSKRFKSARVVGDVLGKYHPHGDSSVYDASVRLENDFTLRYPLIDGQGNFGSRDGDGAAAMRYTEMRLMPISDLLLSEINMGTVDFKPNYDGTTNEPAILPARLPILLMNGAMGIAIGMATNMPPHNIREVTEAAILAIKELGKAKRSTDFFERVMTEIKGPDFPEGGQIISSQGEIIDAYRAGRGSLRVRSRWEIEQMSGKDYRIIVNEIPYGVATTTILSQIEEILNPKIKKGKKALDQTQLNKKQALAAMIGPYRNESGEKVRLVIEPRNHRVNSDELVNFLLTNTDMEVSFSLNMTMIGNDGRPQQKSITDILLEWAEFRFSTVTRRTQFSLNKALARLHILEGRMIAFVHIEEVIRVIRESDEAKANLMQRFALSEIQAEDILEIRLRQLANLEGIRIEKEMAELKLEAKGLRELLDNSDLMRTLIIKEMREDVKKYGDERRTIMVPAERIKIQASDLTVNEPTTIILSKQGWIRSRKGHEVDVDALSHKPGDGTLHIIKTRTVNPVVLIDSNGRSYTIQASQIPGGNGEGVPVTTMIEIQNGGRIVHMLTGNPEDKYLFAGANGYGFVAPLSGLIARPKAGKAFMTVDDKEAILPPIHIEAQTHLAAFSSQGRLLVFQLEEMKTLASGGKGVMVMDIPEGEKLTAVELFGEPMELKAKNQKGAEIVLSGESLGKYILKRARKGANIA